MVAALVHINITVTRNFHKSEKVKRLSNMAKWTVTRWTRGPWFIDFHQIELLNMKMSWGRSEAPDWGTMCGDNKRLLTILTTTFSICTQIIESFNNQDWVWEQEVVLYTIRTFSQLIGPYFYVGEKLIKTIIFARTDIWSERCEGYWHPPAHQPLCSDHKKVRCDTRRKALARIWGQGFVLP